MIKSVYLAGPDVFLPNARQIGKDKVTLCADHGLVGFFPFDAPEQTDAAVIYEENLALMRKADAILANLTPFRGPSADVGTVFELGFFAGLGKPVFAYSSDTRSFAERTRAMLGDMLGETIVEDFGLADNLMLDCAVSERGGVWIRQPGSNPADIAAFDAFRAALQAIETANGKQQRRQWGLRGLRRA